jgi:hypothetical protein
MSPIHILSPPYRPGRCGVTDHSGILAAALQATGEVTAIHYVEPAAIPSTHRRAARELLRQLDEVRRGDVAILQYSAYGYEKRGVATWIVGVMKQLKDRGVSIVTILHELWPEGVPFLSSSFFLQTIQRSATVRCARLSDLVVLSSPDAATRLRRFVDARSILLPIFSNVGEPVGRVPINARNRTGVVFGGAAWKSVVYGRHLPVLRELLRGKQIETIVDVGSSPVVDPVPQFLCLGALSAAQVSQQLSATTYGFLDAPLAALTKSGVFAAYAAHGVIPVVLNGGDDERQDDTLRRGVHYVLPGDVPTLAEVDRESISAALYEWYQPHNSREYALHLRDAIEGFHGQ